MEQTDILAKQMMEQHERIAANAHTHAVLELATLSLLIDQKTVTLAEIETRVRQVQRRSPSQWDDEAVTARLDLLLGILKDVYGPKPRAWTPQVIEGDRNHPPEDR
jgi:hypothetical protein